MSFFYTSVANIRNRIHVRGYKNGEAFDKSTDFGPTLYTTTKQDTGWKSINGSDLLPRKFDSIRDAKDWMKDHDGISNMSIHGQTKWESQFILKAFGADIDYDMEHVNIGYTDIEVASEDGFPEPEEANHPVLTITHMNSKEGIYHVWGLVDYSVAASELEHLKDKIVYTRCQTETELLTRYLNFWSMNTPDIITGWYVRMFDIPYLVNRITKLIGPESVKRLSPWGVIRENVIEIHNKKEQTYEILGVQTMDYIELFKKFGYVFGTQETYRLDHIASVVLGERKLSYEEHGSLHNLYKEDPQKYVDYNIKDVELVRRIDQELGYIDLAGTIAYRSGSSYKDTLGTLAVWDNLIYRHLHEKNIVIPPKVRTPNETFPGGFVKEPQVGAHDWVVSFDLNSLYPNLIVQYNMSAETITGDIDPMVSIESILDGYEPDCRGDSVAANGVHFRNENVGIIPSVVKQIYEERVVVKKKMIEAKKQYEKTKDVKMNKLASKLENEQMAAKILLNSGYGAFGNNHFRFFDLRMASAVTLSGQLTIRWAERAVNDYMNKILGTDTDYVVAIDTDSVYIRMNELVEKVFNKEETEDQKIVEFLDKVCVEKFEPLLEQSYAKLAKVLNVKEERMVMGREAIASRGIWTAKKRYILSVHNNEGVQYAEPKLKVMGIESVKSSTPFVCREKLKEIFSIIVDGTEEDVQKFIKDFRIEFSSLGAEEVSFPRGISDLDKYKDPLTIYKKGTPIHVRGGLVYNEMLSRHKLDKQYDKIKSGEKVKFCYLKVPNTCQENVISFPNVLPRELDLGKYVDYDTQYDKSFVEPLRAVLDAIGWEVEKVSNLESFFG